MVLRHAEQEQPSEKGLIPFKADENRIRLLTMQYCRDVWAQQRKTLEAYRQHGLALIEIHSLMPDASLSELFGFVRKNGEKLVTAKTMRRHYNVAVEWDEVRKLVLGA